MPPDPIIARFDNLRSGWARSFSNPSSMLVATTLDEVVPTLAAAEAAAMAGNWVAGYVAFEAGPAFDPAIPEREGGALPLAWFAVFDRAEATTPIDRHPGGVPRVGPLGREGGAAWFRDGVDDIREHIALGDVYQVNLTDSFVADFAGEPMDLYASLARTQRGAYNAYLDLGDHVIASASPELFVRWIGDELMSRPMKGTRTRGIDGEADAAVAAELVASPKDRAENVMIVDLIRNDMSKVADVGTVVVTSLFDVERYETVWQLTSTVTCRVRPDVGIAEVFGAMFPCGSVTGAPKVAAMRAIARLEASPRGPYCGAIGLLAPPGAARRASFSVAIRTAVVDRSAGLVTYGAGGGITWDSHPVDEDAEAESKAMILRRPRPTFELLETLRVVHQAPLRWAEHSERLRRSADYFGYRLDLEAVNDAVHRAAASSTGPTRLRVTVARGGEVELVSTPLPPSSDGIVRLVVARARIRSLDPFCRHKTTFRAHYEHALAGVPDGHDALCVNERDEVVETTVANVLYRWQGGWYTPPLTSGGLDGVGRAALLRAGLVTERALPLADLEGCESLAVVSSLRGVRTALLAAHGVDDVEGEAGGAHIMDSHHVRAPQRGGAAGADGGDVPFLDIDGTAERGDEPLS
jgi:para-aminobenzoate synthetase/4-amino-4-deoxychorismate lyase